MLAALNGNLDLEGGNRPWGHRVREACVDLDAEEVASLRPPLGAKEHSVFIEHYGEGQGMRLSDAIEDGEIRAVFSIGMNVMMWPNSGRLRRALASLEFFSVCDFFETPTSDLATVFFPAATHLERQALMVSGSGRIQYRPAAVTPRGKARGDTELVFEVAGALGLDGHFWSGDILASYDARLAGLGPSFADLPGTGEPLTVPELAQEFPLVLTSGARSSTYTHSQGRQLASLTRREPEPRVQINPVDVNLLIPDAGLDPISGFPPFRSSLCQVQRLPT